MNEYIVGDTQITTVNLIQIISLLLAFFTGIAARIAYEEYKKEKRERR